jgi:hypothetical protein
LKSRICRRDPETGEYAPLRLPPPRVPNHRERLEAQAQARIDADPVIVEIEGVGTSGSAAVVIVFCLIVSIALFRGCHGA